MAKFVTGFLVGAVLGTFSVASENPFGPFITAFGEQLVSNAPYPFFSDHPYWWGLLAIAIWVFALALLLDLLWRRFKSSKVKGGPDDYFVHKAILLLIMLVAIPQARFFSAPQEQPSIPSVPTASPTPLSPEDEARNAVVRYWELLNNAIAGNGSFRSAWYKTTPEWRDNNFPDGFDSYVEDWKHITSVEVETGGVFVGTRQAEVEAVLTFYSEDDMEILPLLFCMELTSGGWLIDIVNVSVPCPTS